MGSPRLHSESSQISAVPTVFDSPLSLRSDDQKAMHASSHAPIPLQFSSYCNQLLLMDRHPGAVSSSSF